MEWSDLQEQRRQPERNAWEHGPLVTWRDLVLPSALRAGELNLTITESTTRPRFGTGHDVTEEVAMEMREAARSLRLWTHD